MSDGVNHLVRNRHLVEDLGGALRSGQHGLSTVPGLLKRVLVEGSWREFTTQRGERIEHDRFADFVTTPPLAGIGATAELIERVISDDHEAVKLFRAAMKGTNNISTLSRTTRHGTSRAYALERLERDAPELHADVLAGNLTAHAAMVKAGYRPPTFTVRADSPESIAAALRKKLTPEQITDLMRLLSEGA